MEYFDPVNGVDQREGVRAAVRNKLNTKDGAFAVLNVGNATAACKDELNLVIQFAVIGTGADPSHAGIFGFAAKNAATARVLAELVGPCDTFPANS